MNKTVEIFLRKDLKAKLFECTPQQQHLFKRMYSHQNIELHIEDVVDQMPVNKLDHALTQVENTLRR